MNRIEKPEDVVVVSRREWIRMSTLAAAGAALSGGLAACQRAEPPISTENVSKAQACPAPCPTPKDALKMVKDDTLRMDLQNAQTTTEVQYGLIAAYIGLIIRHQDFDAHLLTPGKADAIFDALKLDEKAWGTITAVLSKEPYLSQRNSAIALWDYISPLYGNSIGVVYPQGQCGNPGQIVAIGNLPQSS